ncbi:MAG: ribonuclease E/G [Clostridium sp.]|nr:ribonuclease E/G [Acetatifactor muris]MCM1526546.1 ribonuclease E/G [Bacteroides sp.]MCM1562328.1 ribonuclease E/G [Clostridium sp.]
MSRRISQNKDLNLTEEVRDLQTGGKLVFTKYNGRDAAFWLSDNRLRAARFFPGENSRLGAVYIAKVKNVVKNLDACFVEIGNREEDVCFLSKKDSAYPFVLNRNSPDGRLREGDELPVQIIRGAQKNKQPSVTTLFSISNEYFALSVGSVHTGFSAKLSPEQKKSLRRILKKNDLLTPTSPVESVPTGLVVRTRAAEFLTDEEHAEERVLTALNSLLSRWRELFETIPHRTCFSRVAKPPSPVEDVLEHLVSPREYEEIITDNADIYELLQNMECIPADKRIRFHDPGEAGFDPVRLYGLESKMKTALERRVWLKSGAYLIIDVTEALTVIDVNSGKCEAKKDPEENYLRINREAAEEIALQLRLRNLSGIIIADFINMKSPAAQTELLRYLTALTAADRQQTTVVDMTALGLVEITRKKAHKSLREQMEER